MSTTSVAGHGPAHPEIATPAIAESRLTAIACRALDVAGAALLLVGLSPLFALLAVMIVLDSPGRVIFRQRRVGRGGRPFTVNKFRTMRSEASHQTHKDYVLQLIERDAADEDSELFKLSADSRVTRVGRLLRKSSLDELPAALERAGRATCRSSDRGPRSSTRSRNTRHPGSRASPSGRA